MLGRVRWATIPPYHWSAYQSAPHVSEILLLGGCPPSSSGAERRALVTQLGRVRGCLRSGGIFSEVIRAAFLLALFFFSLSAAVLEVLFCAPLFLCGSVPQQNGSFCANNDQNALAGNYLATSDKIECLTWREPVPSPPPFFKIIFL